MGVGGQGHAPVPIVQEAEWAPGPVWRGAKNLVHKRIRSPDRPARSESLYRLSYRGPPTSSNKEENVCFVIAFAP
jgi:hypothetical protein